MFFFKFQANLLTLRREYKTSFDCYIRDITQLELVSKLVFSFMKLVEGNTFEKQQVLKRNYRGILE